MRDDGWMGARGKSAAQPILPLLTVAVQPLPLLSLCPPGLIPALGRSLAGPLKPTGARGRQNSCGGSTATCHWTSSPADRHSDQLTDLEFCPFSSTSSRGTRLNLKHATTLSPAQRTPCLPACSTDCFLRSRVSSASAALVVPSINLFEHELSTVGREVNCAKHWVGQPPRRPAAQLATTRRDTMPCHAMRLMFTAPLPPAATVDRAGHLTRVTGKGTLLAAVPSIPRPQPLRAT